MKRLSAFVLILLLSLALAVPASANSAEPPGITIIVENAPDDVSLTLELAEDPGYPIRTQKAYKCWEVYFHLYGDFQGSTLKNAVIRVESSEKQFTCPLPQEVYNRYNNLLTLDFQTETLMPGQRWWRQPVLTAIRISLTLLVEGLIFFAYGFRTKRSWVAFLVINLLTQGWLNYNLNGAAFASNLVFGLFFLEFLILIAESIAFPLATKEVDTKKCLRYAFVANAASWFAGMILITNLPV